jgi:hypothetical protein
MTVTIPFLDLKAAYVELKDEIDKAYHRVMDSGWYILDKGYHVALVYHESDDFMFAQLDDRLDFEVLTGPDHLHPLLGLLPVPIPEHICPVTLYLLSPPPDSHKRP